VDVAKGQGVQRARLADLQRCRHLVVRVDRALVRAGDGLAVGGEFEVAHLVGELFSLRMEIQRDPTDVVFGGIVGPDSCPSVYSLTLGLDAIRVDDLPASGDLAGFF